MIIKPQFKRLIYNKPQNLLELVMTLDGQRASLLDFLSDSLFCQYKSSPMNHKNGRKTVFKQFVSILVTAMKLLS